MLTWAVIFLLLAIVLAVFGFSGAAGTATAIAQFLFYVFAILMALSIVISFFSSVRRKR